MIRFVLSFFGAFFSWVVTAAVFAALTVGAIFWMYSRDLPDHEYLAQYTPKTISRIYSGEGRLMDEFADRTAHVRADRGDPGHRQMGVHLGRGQEFLYPQGFRRARHGRRALGRDPHKRQDAARCLDDPAAGCQELPSRRRPHGRAQDQGTDPRHEARRYAAEGQDPRALPQRDRPRLPLVRGRLGRADLFQQDPRRPGAGRGRLSRRACRRRPTATTR